MKTYQDLLAVGERERDRVDFVRLIINDYKSSNAYQMARTADQYDRGLNTTILTYQKTLTTVTGKVVPDAYRATHRCASNFFSIFTTQLNQYLLGNGVEWANNSGEKLGKDFDTQLQKAGKLALCAGVSYGFFNFDHLEVFSALEFAPLYDEENGALMAGVRFWQIDESKPLRATLYEVDGYTNFLWVTKRDYTPDANVWDKLYDNVYEQPKRPYILKAVESDADGVEIYAGENYPSFPIVPLWGNPHRQSELINMREKIDAYDFIVNGFEDDLDNAQIYWIIKGAGGMDDPDLAQFLSRLHMVGAAAPADGQEVEPVTVSIPYDAREKLLDRLEKMLYRDAMIVNTDDLANGAITATQIRAAYERQNVKADQYEYCVIEFVQGILAIAGLEDDPTFTRSKVVNTQEEIQTIVAAAQHLGRDYVTRKILSLLGDADMADEVLQAVDLEDMDRMEGGAE